MGVVVAEPPWSALQYDVPPGVYDELYSAPGKLRPQWAEFREALREMSAEDFERRTRRAERLLLENGVTYNVFGEGGELQRPWRLDLLPLIVSGAEWDQVEAGLSQRARLLNVLIEDLYGDQRSLKEGWVPADLIFTHPGFQRAFYRLSNGSRPALVLYGAELARAPNGQWWVMADRTEAPAGAGFALENRIVTARTLPHVTHRVGVERLAPFFIRLQNALKRQAPRASESPRIVLLSSGPRNSLYFEDVYLARYLGYTLVEGSDLAVRDEQVFLKTLAGLVPVDVILSRGVESGVDPLELGGASPHGVSGLLQAIRAGNVALANIPGSALVEPPVFMAFLPVLCRQLLGEDLKMPSVATWWCGQPEALQYVLEHFVELVIKPAFQPSGSQEIVPSALTAAEQEALKARIVAAPREFIAQEFVARSSAPIWSEGKVTSGHVAIRCFLTAEPEGYSLMPGGLIRVALTTEPMQLSITAGASSKDLWVQASGPVDPVTLLVPEDQPVRLRRTSALFPSRVADDLFWLGRSFDRAEFLARLLRTVLDRLASETEETTPEFTHLIRALADQGQIEPGFAVQELSEQLPAIEESLPRTIFDDDEPQGLARAVSEMQRLSARTRDWLSPDTWRKFHEAAGTFFAARGNRWNDLGDVLSVVNELLLDLASVSGLVHNGMIRGPSWRFLDIGRRIERALNIAALLRSMVFTKGIPSKEVLRAVVEIIDCRMTYRARYLDNIQPNAVLDLAITDETNPNSIGFQAAALAEHVEALPQTSLSPLKTEEQRLVLSILHLVRMLTHAELAQASRQEVRTMIERLDPRLRLLSDTLNRKYFVHSGTPRQILVDKALES